MSPIRSDVPIVVRATTLEYISPDVRSIAMYNAASQKMPVFLVGCWPQHKELGENVNAISLAHHPACSETWREEHLMNKRSPTRLAPLQPMWGAVELLTAAALEMETVLPHCRAGIGMNCTAFVIDPDVLLPPAGTMRSPIRAAFDYYDASRFDAVLHFAAPSARFPTLELALQHASTPTLMGNRHVSFMSPRAARTLATLTEELLPKYTADKPSDMLLPNLLPARAPSLSILWLLDSCGAFQRLGSHSDTQHERGSCQPHRLTHLDTPANEGIGARGRDGHYACSAIGSAIRRNQAVATVDGAPSPELCDLRGGGLSLFDAFLYMLPHERPSEHVCSHLECLAPVKGGSLYYHSAHGAEWRQMSPVARLEQQCATQRGTMRRMPWLRVNQSGVYGRLHRVPTATALARQRVMRTAAATDDVLDSVSADEGLRFLSVHLQGNAKGPCLRFMLRLLEPPHQAPSRAPNRPEHYSSPRLGVRSMRRAVVDNNNSRSVDGRGRVRNASAAVGSRRGRLLERLELTRRGRAVHESRGRGATGTRPWWVPDWLVESRAAAAARTARPRGPLCASDVAIIVMGSSTAPGRLQALRETWANATRPLVPLRAVDRAVDSLARPSSPSLWAPSQHLKGPRLLIMSDRQNARTGEVTTPRLRGRRSYWDAQARHFEGLRLLYTSTHPESSPQHPQAQRAPERPPSWTLLVDDDSFVNVPHLLQYASRFDASAPLLIGHVLDGIWAGRGFSGGAGMLLSLGALRRFGLALSSGRMPLPPPGVPNDQHIASWASQLDVTCASSNLFSYGAVPADARIVSVLASRLGDSESTYTGSGGPNTFEAIGKAAQLAFQAVAETRGALDAQVLGAVVLHRVSEGLMRVLHRKLSALSNNVSGSCAVSGSRMT